MKILESFVCLGLIALDSCICTNTVNGFRRNSDFDGYTCPASEKVFEHNNIVSLTVCLSDCVRVGSCQSVCYNSGTGECHGCTFGYIRTDTLEVLQGYSYYESTECPVGWLKWQQSCYKATGLQDTFFHGQAICNNQQGHAVYINSEEENNVLYQHFIDDTLLTDVLFIGIRDARSTTTREWVFYPTGELISYKNFAGNEETHLNERCTAFYVDHVGMWITYRCQPEHPTQTLCEIDL